MMLGFAARHALCTPVVRRAPATLAARRAVTAPATLAVRRAVRAPLLARRGLMTGTTVARPRALLLLKGDIRREIVTTARARATWCGSHAGGVTATHAMAAGTTTRELSGRPPKGMGRLAGAVGLASVAFGKMKYVLVALKLTKVAPVLSMVATSAAYSLIFGPAYGCGMVGLIFVHECGHILAMRAFGIPFSPMVFVPFIGAMVQMEKHPASALQGAIVALAGPVVGGAAAGATALAGHALDSQLLMALGEWQGLGSTPSGAERLKHVREARSVSLLRVSPGVPRLSEGSSRARCTSLGSHLGCSSLFKISN